MQQDTKGMVVLRSHRSPESRFEKKRFDNLLGFARDVQKFSQ
jgi:hypothetical protein